MSRVLFAAFTVLTFSAALPQAYAQVTIAPTIGAPYSGTQPYSYTQQTPYPTPYSSSVGYQTGGQRQTLEQQAASSLEPQQQQQHLLPDGIDRLYAMEGNNTLFMMGTEAGYQTAMEIVKNIDGDLDIISTQISLVSTTRSDLSRLGVTLGDDGSLTVPDMVKLLEAQQNGKMSSGSIVRIVTREDTAVDAQIGRDNGISLTIVPRDEAGGKIGIQFIQPVSETAFAMPGATTVIALPPAGTGDDIPISLLFITPKILPSDFRPG